MSKKPSVRKILQALYYLQSNAPQDNHDRFDKRWLLNMLYFADRYHLRHYGYLASGDTYYAVPEKDPFSHVSTVDGASDL